MGRVLLMTVGTGIGGDIAARQNLAHGLRASIEHYHPGCVVLFGSEASQQTVESLQQLQAEETGEQYDNLSFVTLTDIDNFDHCFTQIQGKIAEYSGDEVILDYTSGTKTMTMSTALASMLYHKKLSLISGKRGASGLVVPGTEKILEQNLYSAYDIELERTFKARFNLYRFAEARDILGRIVVLDEVKREMYEDLVDGYALWDKFAHAGADERILHIPLPECAANKQFLGKMNRCGDVAKIPFILADLLNNAGRRLGEEKFDDSVARLYRVVELLAQYVLQAQFQINPGDVQVANLPPDIQAKYEPAPDAPGDPKVQLALVKDYELLRDLNHPLGTQFFANKRLGNLLRKRNDSILAHGLQPVCREDAAQLLEITAHFCEQVVPELPSLRDLAEFAKLGE